MRMRQAIPESESRNRFPALLFFSLFMAVYVIVWVTLPSQNVHNDALDELMIVEAQTPRALGKHPLAEPSVWLVMQGLRAAGYKGDAIRPGQVWNALWMTVALAGVAVFALRVGRSALVAAGMLSILAGCYSSIHLAVDPYLLYWPPGLALMTWGLVLCRDDGAGRETWPRGETDAVWRLWTVVLACLTLSVLFNPLCAIALPLVAMFWWAGDRPEAAERPLATAAQAIAFLAVPVAILFASSWLTGWSWGSTGAFGGWSRSTLHGAWFGLSGSLVPKFEGVQLLGAFRGRHDFGSLATTAAVLLMPLTALVVAIHVLSVGGRVLQFFPWAVASIVVGGVILWWDPAQVQFWLLPLWLLAMGAIDADGIAAEAGADTGRANFTRRMGAMAALLVCLQGAALCVANGAGYVWPAATRPNEKRSAAERLARRFTKNDWLILPIFPDLYVDYYGHVPTASMMGLCMSRPAGKTTFDYFREAVDYVKKHGGATYMEIPAPGEPWIPLYVHDRMKVDYDENEFDRIQWGRTIEAEGRVFREVLAIK